jgi:hypothetical protein
MVKEEIQGCMDCWFYNYDTDYCNHPSGESWWVEIPPGKPYPEACPLKKEPVLLVLEEGEK